MRNQKDDTKTMTIPYRYEDENIMVTIEGHEYQLNVNTGWKTSVREVMELIKAQHSDNSSFDEDEGEITIEYVEY